MLKWIFIGERRQITYLLILLLTSIVAHAQWVVDAGGPTYSCVSDSNAINFPIGGNPTSVGGSAPYSYSWYIKPIPKYTGATSMYFASDYLNDTTLANPMVIDRYMNDTLQFFVTVTDSFGNSQTDSTRVYFSDYTINLGTLVFNILQGDSVYLFGGSNVGGGLGKKQYSWNPKNGLTVDTLPTGFWAKPMVTTAYSVTVTDQMNCSITGPPYYFIYVSSLGVSEEETQILGVFPNPTSSSIRIQVPPDLKISQVRILNALGERVLEGELLLREYDISSFSRGLYFLQVVTEKGILHSRFLIK